MSTVYSSISFNQADAIRQISKLLGGDCCLAEGCLLIFEKVDGMFHLLNYLLETRKFCCYTVLPRGPLGHLTAAKDPGSGNNPGFGSREILFQKKATFRLSNPPVMTLF